LNPDILDETPSLEEIESDKIEWKAGKNLCVTEIKKKQKAKSGRNKGQVKFKNIYLICVKSSLI
jgi:hypothetical protein